MHLKQLETAEKQAAPPQPEFTMSPHAATQISKAKFSSPMQQAYQMSEQSEPPSATAIRQNSQQISTNKEPRTQHQDNDLFSNSSGMPRFSATELSQSSAGFMRVAQGLMTETAASASQLFA